MRSFRRPHATILAALAATAAAYVLVPLALLLTCIGGVLIPLVSPVLVLLVLTEVMIDPSAGSAASWYFWPAHCGWPSAISATTIWSC